MMKSTMVGCLTLFLGLCWGFASAAPPDGAGPAAATAVATAAWDTKQWRSRDLAGNPTWMSPAMQVDVSGLKWLSVRAKSQDSSTGIVYWTTTAAAGRKTMVFHMKPDGVARVYSVCLGSSGDWAGQVKSLGLGVAKGKTAEFFDAALLAQPTAPPELETTFFDLRDAVNRAGQPSVLLATVRNIGGTPATGLNASANLGAAVLPSQTIASLGVGETANLTWPVRLDTAGSYRVKLELTGTGLARFVTESDVTVTAIAPAATPSAAQAAKRADGSSSPYVPGPAKVTGAYDIGVYYFPGWQTYTRWSVLDPFPEKRPALGYYREGDPEVADWQLKWAAEHGITFFIYDWYWESGGRQLEHALHDGYMKARYNTAVKFALLWANHNQPGTSSEQDLLAVTSYWIANYFHRADYYKVDGKPVVIIFSPDRFTQDMGSAKVKAAFVKMRDLARKAGIPDLYIMACEVPDMARLKTRKLEGYDATTGYNYPSAGAANPLYAPYDLAVTGYERLWKQIADMGIIDYVPVTDPGWDSRPWDGDQALVRTDRSPAKFKSMLEKAKAFVDTRTPVGKTKMVLVEAWNEFGEGAAIEPHKEFGFGYLDAIRSVFTSAPEAHADVVPADVGLGPYELSPPAPGFLWDFTKPGASLDWAPQNLSSFGLRGRALQGVSSNADPAVYSPRFKLDAGSRSAFAVRMKLDGGGTAQLFWSTSDKRISEETSQRFDIIADGEYHDYVLELADSPEWAGTITQLRLDPCDAADSNIAVEYARVD